MAGRVRAMNHSARLFVLGVAAIVPLVSQPAFAQADLSGHWRLLVHEDTTTHARVVPGEYLAVPLTDAGRMRADSWSDSLQTLPEMQCYPHPIQYAEHGGPANSLMRIESLIDPATQQLVAYYKRGNWMEPERTIWMDGRPHPPEHAPHTFQGFSTGRWEGATLMVKTSHVKDGYLAMNGIPASDIATLTEHWVRHGNYLTSITIVEDRVYLAEPFVKSSSYLLDPKVVLPRYPCGPNEVAVEVPRAKHEVPHHLPGTNPFLSEFAIRETLPLQTIRGYAESLYPEYVEKLKTLKPATATTPAR